MAAATAIIRLKRKRNEDPLPTLYLDVDQAVQQQHDTTKRAKVEQAPPSIFTLAMTMEPDEYTTLDRLDIDLWKTQLDKRPESSDSDTSSKKRAFSQVLTSPPKFRMSRKRPRNNPPDVSTTQDVQVFDAIRESHVDISGVPMITSSGIPDEIQSGDVTKDIILAEMLQSYLTVDGDNRTCINLKDEYVYDIYYRSATTVATVPTDANFGVLVYESDPEMIEDDEVVNDEDADSNSEGYYQNSYPDEDEWAGEGWGSDEDENEYGKRRKNKIGFDSDDEIGSDSGEDGFSYSETE